MAVVHFHALHHGAHLRGVVAADHVDVIAVRAALHGLGRHHGAAGDGTQLQAHVDELARPQGVVGVGEDRTRTEGAAVGGDAVVDHLQLAVAADHVRIAAIQRRHVQRGGRLAAAHRLQLALGQVEGHVDRADLGQGDDGGAGADDIAHVHAADAGDAVDRRGHAGELQLHLRRAHLRIVGRHRRLVLRHLVTLGIQVCARDVLLVGRVVGALVVHPRGRQQRLVLALGRQRLVVAGLQGARVDLRQQLALLHFLAFLEIQAHQLAADLRADRDGIERGHRAQCAGVDRYILGGGGHDRDRYRAAVLGAIAVRRVRPLAVVAPIEHPHCDEHHDEHRYDQQCDLPKTRHATTPEGGPGAGATVGRLCEAYRCDQAIERY
ncbi:hypothetical protein XPU_2259 [Xanthomonas arboricola pv. pruni str. MAFF 311562]|uniref:Uncharacterized protein n=1 Tax=Xanthomonas arboricola pv. pruni str. MAFF 311562 TaxID=1414836 RepID=W4S2U7_9XANT|nr:hypothetical protein XPU_2259 [Xanthomonas arboricola pv. pruni str. MAFF 311562]